MHVWLCALFCYEEHLGSAVEGCGEEIILRALPFLAPLTWGLLGTRWPGCQAVLTVGVGISASLPFVSRQREG